MSLYPVKRPAVDLGSVLWIFLTKSKVAIIDREDADLAGLNWTAKRGRHTWYGYHRREGVMVELHREIALRMGLGIEGMEVDHKNRDGLDCRRQNLRAATRQQNAANARLQSNNTSGLKGVYWSKRHEKWYAKICWTTAGTRHQKFLGFAPSREDAAKIFASAAKPIHGEFSRD